MIPRKTVQYTNETVSKVSELLKYYQYAGGFFGITATI